jgi:hypothetical protein
MESSKEFIENTIIENKKIDLLKAAIREGIDSGVMRNFDPKSYLKFLKKNKKKQHS